MINVLFLHGMAEGTRSLLAKNIRKYLPEGYELYSPDLYIDPEKSFGVIDRYIREYKIDILVGHSLGGFMAQKYREMPKILLNPSLGMSYGYLCRFEMPYKDMRDDDLKRFRFTTPQCRAYKAMEKTEFEGITEREREITIGVFGKKDILTRLSAHRFKKHYKYRTMIPGRHFPTEEVIRDYVVPEIVRLGSKL
ncbi:MAG: alpha/beta hydrolase [Bacteroidales bacterium]|nr:alpha/beta hydrolase [Bacteroidales bacterium]